MVNIKTIPMSKETYGTLVRIANRGFCLSMINAFMMLLLSVWTKPVEVGRYPYFEITRVIDTTPIYISLFSHFVATLVFGFAYLRIREADIQGAFGLSEKSFGEPDLAGDDFSRGKESFIAVLEPIGSGSNQWLAFFLLGLPVSILGVLSGVLSAIVVALSASGPDLMLSIAVVLPQVFTLFEVTAQYLVTAPYTLQHSVEPNWPEQLRKALEWRLGKKSTGLQIDHDERVQVHWRISQRSTCKKTVRVRLSTEEAYCYIMQYLSTAKATVTSSEPYRIVAEHGKWGVWDPKDTKKKITVYLSKSGTSSSEISVNVKLSRIYRFLFWLTVFLAVIIVLVAYQRDQFIGSILAVFYAVTIVPVIIWDFFEKDAFARDLLFGFLRDGLLDIEMTEGESRWKVVLEKSERLITALVGQIDGFYRTVFGGGIIREHDFPFMPIYRFRDYRSNIYRYGKTNAKLGEEGSDYDFADAASRKASEIKLVELDGHCKVECNKEILAEKIVDPMKTLENLKILGRPGTVSLAGPWGSFMMIGLGILLFSVSFGNSAWTVSKQEFVYVAAIGIWVLAATILMLFVENSSTLVYIPESLKTLLSLVLFPMVICFLYLFLPDGIYPLSTGMYLWSLAAVVFGIMIVPHTSGKPFSRSLYLYVKEPDSNHFSYKDKAKDAPYWLDANAEAYWVFRFVLQWLWEISFPYPHRDVERIEIWVNAKTGKPEWAVTDYHYRELWYEIPSDSEEIVIWWDSNFHTLRPIVDKDLVRSFRNSRQSKRFFDHILDNEYRKKALEISKQIAAVHPPEKVNRFFRGFEKVGAKECARLPWKYWRYPFGAYPERETERWKKYASSRDCEGHGAAILEEQFS
jgi:hypothetical protein